MPILYVNPSGARRKKRFAFGKASGGKKRAKKARRKGRMPKALAAYWAKKRSKKVRRKLRKAKRTGHKRSRRAKMSKRRKKGSRRRGRKRSKKSYARAARLGARRRKRRSGSSKRRRGRRSKRKSSRRRRRARRRSRKSYARAAKLGRRRRRRKLHGPIYRKSKAGRGGTVRGHGAITLVMPKRNPSRRRRRKGSRRRGRRTAARLGHRRRRMRHAKRSRRGRRKYRKFGRLRGRTVYVRNPGRMLMDLAKRALPIVLATIGSKAISSRIGPRIPMLDRLGTFQGPVVSVLTLLGLNFATKKVKFLAKHRDKILIGAAIAAIHETIGALPLPAGIKGLLGMGDTYTQALADYVATSDYEQVVGMSDYVATGDMEQELGMDQEMGFTQDMGDLGPFGQGNLGGASSKAFLAPVPNQKFLAPVPGHSFTAPVPDVSEEYDNPKMLYTGIFSKY